MRCVCVWGVFVCMRCVCVYEVCVCVCVSPCLLRVLIFLKQVPSQSLFSLCCLISSMISGWIFSLSSLDTHTHTHTRQNTYRCSQKRWPHTHTHSPVASLLHAALHYYCMCVWRMCLCACVNCVWVCACCSIWMPCTQPQSSWIMHTALSSWETGTRIHIANEEEVEGLTDQSHGSLVRPSPPWLSPFPLFCLPSPIPPFLHSYNLPLPLSLSLSASLPLSHPQRTDSLLGSVVVKADSWLGGGKIPLYLTPWTPVCLYTTLARLGNPMCLY